MESLINRVVKTCAIGLLISIPWHSFAASDRLDYDLDDDGLIEINDWDDVIAINNNANGKALYGSNLGCPVNGCNGFELTTSLDFDTNGDGKLNELDTFWNNGEGWNPLTPYDTSSSRMSAIFEGNGRVIYNLMINRPHSDNQGFFGLAFGATIRNLGFSGKLMSITGRNYVGALAGSATQYTNISNCFSTGAIFATGSNAGGLVGELAFSEVKASFTSGSVQAPRIVGGIVGRANFSTLNTLFSTAVLTSNDYGGGIVGYGGDSILTYAFATGRIITTANMGGGLVGIDSSLVNTTYSYWTLDVMKANDRPWGVPVTLKELQCPTSADNTTCATGKKLYEGWGSLTNSQGNPYWSFGNNAQLPGLVLNGITYRDSDGDGVLDTEDSFPNDYAISNDSDGDGIANAWNPGCDSACQIAHGTILDQLPNNIAASIDMDRDGLPERWNIQCNATCQATSGLTLDTHPLDGDNDGIPDTSDASDTDNNNGIIDADSDSNGLIDINNLEQLNAIRNNLAGTGRQMTAAGVMDFSGCPLRLINGILQNTCHGYELLTNLDFDTNGDGKLDAQDTYWNNGLGWQSIGTIEQPFTATFEGNKYLLRNLMINRWDANNQGLFGYLNAATIRNLGFSGKLMSITGASDTGALAGATNNSKISGCSSVGTINGRYSVGGLVGRMSGGSVTASFTGGAVNGLKQNVGGIVGRAARGKLEAIFSSALVNGDTKVGGIIGEASDIDLSAALSTAHSSGNSGVGELIGVYDTSTTITHSYWLTQTQSAPVINQPGLGLTLTQLQCPTTADNTSCVSGKIIYQGWGDLKDAKGNPYWSFGNANQLPGLTTNGVTNRDNDGDGTFNADDLWPNSFAISKDTDGDGAIDSFHPRCDDVCQIATGFNADYFPNNPAASADQDADGKPDAWNSSCDITCQNNSGLVLDIQVDHLADADSDGLIEISSWAQLDAIRNNPKGTGRQMKARGNIDSSGCPAQLIDGISQPHCHGYELNADLDFDTNADGTLDAKDTYWNHGTGWTPIFFSATFNGNGHVIRNLMINRLHDGRDGYDQGLFSKLENATLRDLRLTGPLMDIKGLENVGSLAGSAIKTSITGFVTTGIITSLNGSTGGLVGSLYESSITNSLALGTVKTEIDWGPGDWPTKYTGGIAGYASASNINAVFSSNTVNGYTYFGGIIGGPDNTAITGAYAIGVVNKTAAPDAAKLPALRCATATDNCANGQSLYGEWDKLKDSEGNQYWVFGDVLQLPGLVINRVIYRIDDNNQLTATPLSSSSSSSSSSNAHSSSSTESSSSISSSSSSSSKSSSPAVSQPGSSGTKKGGGSADLALLLMLSGLVAGLLRNRRETKH